MLALFFRMHNEIGIGIYYFSRCVLRLFRGRLWLQMALVKINNAAYRLHAHKTSKQIAAN